jgi:hypothetical protein
VNVLFLGVGNSRVKGTIAESEQVTRDGGRALILVETFRPWQKEAMPDGVELIGLGSLEKGHWPLGTERLLLFRLPDSMLRAIGRGPARTFSSRARRAYKKSFADRVHRRFMAQYRRIWRNRDHQMLMSSLVRRGELDYVVVTNYASVPWGERIQRELDATSTPRPKVRFSIDDLEDAPPYAD